MYLEEVFGRRPGFLINNHIINYLRFCTCTCGLQVFYAIALNEWYFFITVNNLNGESLKFGRGIEFLERDKNNIRTNAHVSFLHWNFVERHRIYRDDAAQRGYDLSIYFFLESRGRQFPVNEVRYIFRELPQDCHLPSKNPFVRISPRSRGPLTIGKYYILWKFDSVRRREMYTWKKNRK